MEPQNGANPSRLNDPIDMLEANFKRVVDVLSSGASAVEEKVSSAKQTATASASSFAAKAGRVIKDHPIAAFAAFGIVFGAGYVVMRLIRR